MPSESKKVLRIGLDYAKEKVGKFTGSLTVHGTAA